MSSRRNALGATKTCVRQNGSVSPDSRSIMVRKRSSSLSAPDRVPFVAIRGNEGVRVPLFRNRPSGGKHGQGFAALADRYRSPSSSFCFSSSITRKMRRRNGRSVGHLWTMSGVRRFIPATIEPLSAAAPERLCTCQRRRAKASAEMGRTMTNPGPTRTRACYAVAVRALPRSCPTVPGSLRQEDSSNVLPLEADPERCD